MKLEFKDFEKMEQIDRQYFPIENIAPAEESYKWYIANPNSCVVVKESDEVIAYINILSLKEEIYNKVKFNKMNESEIVVEDLELRGDKYFNYIYFPVIAIDKQHRNIKTLRNLLNATKEHMQTILIKHKIIEVMTDCSTKEGQKITQRILKLKPFMKTSHNSTIHICDGDTFIKNLFT